MGNGPQVHEFKLTAHGHAARQARHRQAVTPQRLADDMGSGLALGSEVGGQNHFLNDAIARAIQQGLDANVGRPNPIERAKNAP